jgi:hypothetical protein
MARSGWSTGTNVLSEMLWQNVRCGSLCPIIAGTSASAPYGTLAPVASRKRVEMDFVSTVFASLRIAGRRC